MENFAKVSELVKSIKDLGGDNLEKVQKKSKGLYKSVIQRIKQKEREIMLEMKIAKKDIESAD